ncbi:unnamed protein product [Amoebophrya sp. A25]|nr:unnamed protein product [Amoebophrya sp. A25]|eukprot:GSA25T00023924001.1
MLFARRLRRSSTLLRGSMTRPVGRQNALRTLRREKQKKSGMLQSRSLNANATSLATKWRGSSRKLRQRRRQDPQHLQLRQRLHPPRPRQQQAPRPPSCLRPQERTRSRLRFRMELLASSTTRLLCHPLFRSICQRSSLVWGS